MSQPTISDPAIAPHLQHVAAEDVLAQLHHPHANPNSELHASGVQIDDDYSADHHKPGDARTASSPSSELIMNPVLPIIDAANPNLEPHSTTVLLQLAVNPNLHKSELLDHDTVLQADHYTNCRSSELQDDAPVNELDAVDNNPNFDQQVDNVNPKSELDLAVTYHNPDSEQVDNINQKSELDPVTNYGPNSELQVGFINPNSELDAVASNYSPNSELQVDSINPNSELDAVAYSNYSPNSNLQVDSINPNSELHAVTNYYSPNSDLDAVTNYNPMSEQADNVNPNSKLDDVTSYNPISEQADNTYNPNSELDVVTYNHNSEQEDNFNPNSELDAVTYSPNTEQADNFNPNSELDAVTYSPHSEQANNFNPNSELDAVTYSPNSQQADNFNPNAELDAVTYSPNSQQADNFSPNSDQVDNAIPNSEEADNFNPNSELDAVTIPDSEQVDSRPNSDLQLDAVNTNPNSELDVNVTADPKAELDHAATVAIGFKSGLQIQHDAAHTNPDLQLDTDELQVEIDHHQSELQLLHDADDDHTNPNSEPNVTDQMDDHRKSALDTAFASPNYSEVDSTQSQADYRAASQKSELQYIDDIAKIDQLNEDSSSRIEEYTNRISSISPQLEHSLTDLDLRQTDDQMVALITEVSDQHCSTEDQYRLESMNVVDVNYGADGNLRFLSDRKNFDQYADDPIVHLGISTDHHRIVDGAEQYHGSPGKLSDHAADHEAAAGCELSDDQLINHVAVMDSYRSSELIAESLADQYSDIIAGTDDQYLLKHTSTYNNYIKSEPDSGDRIAGHDLFRKDDDRLDDNDDASADRDISLQIISGHSSICSDEVDAAAGADHRECLSDQMQEYMIKELEIGNHGSGLSNSSDQLDISFAALKSVGESETVPEIPIVSESRALKDEELKEEEEVEEEDGDGDGDGDGDEDDEEEELEPENQNLVATDHVTTAHINVDEINPMQERIVHQRHHELASSDDQLPIIGPAGAKHSKINNAHRDNNPILWSRDHDHDDHHQILQAEQGFISSSTSTDHHHEIAISDDAEVVEIKLVDNESELLRSAQSGRFRKIPETPAVAHNPSRDGPAWRRPMDDGDGHAPDIKEQGHNGRDKGKDGAARFRVKLPPLMVMTGLAIAAVGVAIASIGRSH